MEVLCQNKTSQGEGFSDGDTDIRIGVISGVTEGGGIGAGGISVSMSITMWRCLCQNEHHKVRVLVMEALISG